MSINKMIAVWRLLFLGWKKFIGFAFKCNHYVWLYKGVFLLDMISLDAEITFKLAALL